MVGCAVVLRAPAVEGVLVVVSEEPSRGTSYITADAAEHFGLPRERTVITGAHIDV